MQPLSFQSAETSCWIACMVNGIRFVTGDDRISTPVYRHLQSLLQDVGVEYYTPEQTDSFENTIQQVNQGANLSISYCREADVEHTLLGLQFDRRVVVCDIGDGAHSVLLHNRKGDWFEGFDPWWYGEERCGNRLLKFPKGNCTVNVRIHQRHLFSRNVNTKAFDKGEEYHMGDIEWRFLTLIE